ncbi:transposase family protein [Streptomyces sp. NPDC051940]|uniref:transposase family protein n=1 Tax=Streptomyces sp. NPDC051940 TaxID=3155675 RepID=UPI00342FB90C
MRETLPGAGIRPDESYGSPMWPTAEGSTSATPASRHVPFDARGAELIARVWEALELPGSARDYHFVLQSAVDRLWSTRRAEPEALAALEVSVGTAHAYVGTVVAHLADKAPGLLRVLRETDPDFALVDGTLAECDRVGDGQVDYSSKHRRHGVNVQVVTDPTGRILWLSPALPGRTHDLTAARTHKIIRICERQGVPLLADMACIGAGSWVTTAKRRAPNGELTPTEETINRALSAARAPVERGVARLKSWRIFRRARCSPTRLSSITAAILTLERQR